MRAPVERRGRLTHVVALGLSVNEEVESDLLLEGDDTLDLLLDERVVLGGGDLSLAELGAGNTDLLGLGERSDGGGSCEGKQGVSDEFSKERAKGRTEGGELVDGVLGGETSGVGVLAVVHLGGDGGETLADGLVRLGLKVATSLDGDGVGVEGSLDRGGVGDGLGESGDLGALLSREREPIGDLGLELLLAGEGDGGVEEGRRGGDDDAVSAEDGDRGLGDLEGRGDVVLPDVAARDESEGEDEGGVLDASEDRLELLGSAVEIDVEAVDGELGDELDVGVEAAKVGRDGDLESRGGLGEGSVGRGELGAEGRGGVENESGLIDLDLGGASSLELDEELSEGGNELVEDIDRLERGVLLVATGLADNEVGDGAENDGAGDDASGLGLLELVDGLGVDELEFGGRRDLTLEVVVLGKQSRGSACVLERNRSGFRDSRCCRTTSASHRQRHRLEEKAAR